MDLGSGRAVRRRSFRGLLFWGTWAARSLRIARRGDGIGGRSLRIAGARSTLTSLWKVDDAATAELMTSFYRFILDEGETPAGALRKAKKALRERRAPPRDWAGWVLTGPGD